MAGTNNRSAFKVGAEICYAHQNRQGEWGASTGRVISHGDGMVAIYTGLSSIDGDPVIFWPEDFVFPDDTDMDAVVARLTSEVHLSN